MELYEMKELAPFHLLRRVPHLFDMKRTNQQYPRKRVVSPLARSSEQDSSTLYSEGIS